MPNSTQKCTHLGLTYRVPQPRMSLDITPMPAPRTSPPALDAASNAREIRGHLGLTQARMARLLGVSTRKMSELESPGSPPRPETRRRLTEIDRLSRALGEIMDAADLGPWLDIPNDAFEGSTPLQLVERGEIDRLWQMIHTVRTGQPG